MILRNVDHSPSRIQSIRHTLAYAELFDYPLSSREIQRYLSGIVATLDEVEETLSHYAGIFAHADGLYALAGQTKLFAIRRQREQTALRLWPSAARYGKLIAHLPFVRMVAVTGSLAVNNVAEGADIDYLIVTAPGRLWLTRAQVLLLGRFTARHGIRLCPNYLVTMNALSFNEQTLYTAHELAQMVPLCGLDVYAEIRRQNPWVDEFLPNAIGLPANPLAGMPIISSSRIFPVLEAFLGSAPFQRLEAWEMERKIQKLRDEQNGSAESAFSRDVCKGHDRLHGSRASAAFAARLNALDDYRTILVSK